MNPKTPTITRRVFAAVLSLAALISMAQGGELSPVPERPRYGFSLNDIDGRERSLDEFRGGVVLVSFWASWCTPCLQEMPSLLRLQRSLQGRPFTVLAVNVAEGERRVRTAARRLGLDFPVLLDPDSRVFEAWGGEVLPTAFVLDGEGYIRYAARGPLDWDRVDIRDVLRVLMAEPGEQRP